MKKCAVCYEKLPLGELINLCDMCWDASGKRQDEERFWVWAARSARRFERARNKKREAEK